MDFLSLLKAWPRAKLALADEGRSYTYGELVDEAMALRRSGAASGERRFVLIREDGIYRQLLFFLALSGTDVVPVIATKESRGQEFAASEIPPRAAMGVMTSGSTGKSKLLWRSYASWADFFPEQNRVFGLGEDAVIFCQGSLAFTGNLSIYMGVLSAGGTVIATSRFRPKYWLSLMEEFCANAIYLLPSKLLLLPRFMQEPNLKIKSIVAGSQTMGRKEAERLFAVFPGAELTLYYGASELNYISYIKGSEMTEDSTLIGRPFKGVSVEIRDEEIYIATPCHVEGVAMPFSLKDRGYLDEAGRLHFLGRTDDIISVNGRKVSAAKVEAALRRLAGAEEAAVIKRRAGDADVLAAFIGGEKRAGKQEMLRLLREGLEDFEIPKQFVFLERLPKNESGKIAKRDLAELYP